MSDYSERLSFEDLKGSILENTFPRTEINTRFSGIYFLIDQEEIVYIGQSRNVMARLAVHDADTTKDFNEASWLSCSPEMLNELEARFIFTFRPKLNKSFPKNKKIVMCKKAKIAVREVFGRNLSKRILSAPNVLSYEIRPRFRYYDIDSIFDAMEAETELSQRTSEDMACQ